MKKTFNRIALLSGLALLGLAALITRLSFEARANGHQPDSQPDSPTVSASVQYLARAMDQYHNRFPVYDDVSSAGNHFHALTKFPDENALVTINGSYSLDKHAGATAIRCTFTPGGANFGGFNFQNGILPNGATAPVPNFGTVLNAGVDLSGATALTFWARGQQGGEVVDFFMGGVGWNEDAVNNPCTPDFSGPCPAPDSTPAVKITVRLTTQWTQYSINLTDKDLHYVLGGFGWGVDGALNGNTVFYLDDIQYELSPARQTQRLNEPRFIRSFTTLPLQPDVNDGNQDDDIDLVLRNAAFVYDNALAVLAFLADGSADSVRRAKLIGDAIVYATAHDRSFNDGRLRSAYAAGDIALPPGWTPNNRVGTVPIAGFYVDLQMQFFELSEVRTFDTGNQAWAMVALLALHRRTGDTRYLDAAQLLGKLIHTFRHDAGQYQGFLGGLEYRDGDAALPFVRMYASTEHNLDIYAAFTVMFQITGEMMWQSDAQHAKEFIAAMWDSNRGCYLAGTLDPAQRNTAFAQLPLDVQPWSVLALPDTLTLHPQVLMCAEINHRTMSDGFTGFDFNTDQDGVWFEGTGHMATAYAWTNQLASAETYRQELNRAQATPPFGDGFGIAAAAHDAVTTGFDFKLFRRLHVGAAAWHVFAQLGFNPYYQTTAPLGGSISGAVNYATSTTPKPVPGAVVTAAGTPSATNTTNSAGNYSLTGLGSGPYTVTPTKTGDVNGISSLDASLVAQFAASLITLSPNQQIAADASGNGSITSFDASLIAQTAAGLANSGIAGTWKFVPGSRNYPTLSGNQTNQNFDAILVGDVSGNWTAAAAALAASPTAAPSSSESQGNLPEAGSPIMVSLPNATGATGANVTIPITVGDLTGRGVVSYDFTLTFDPTVLQWQNSPFEAAGTLSSRMNIALNTATPGRLRISAFQTAPLTGAGTLLNLKFIVVGGKGATTTLTWSPPLMFSFNEGDPPATLVNSKLSVTEAGKPVPTLRRLNPILR